MSIQVLDSEIKVRVRKDDALMLLLAKTNSVRVSSVLRWLQQDDVILTTATNLDIIRKGLELPENTTLTQIKEPA